MDQADPPRSPRLRLARLAREAALGVDGVESVGPWGAPQRATHGRGEQVDGVLCAAEPGGRYGVAIYLGARVVALQELAESVRAAVGAAIERDGLADELGAVDVVIEDVVEAGSSR